MLKPLTTLLAAATMLTAAGTAIAQENYPEKTVSILVPAAPGGGTDFMARLIANKLGQALGQSFIVENREGANGNLAMREVARSEADGYTMIFASTGTIATNPFLYKDVGFDPKADFAPITMPVRFFQVLAVNPETGLKTLPELIAYAKEHPGEVTIGNGGLGGTSHLATELLQQYAEIETTIVPYRGTSPAITAVLSGELAASFTGLPAGAPHFESGALIPMAMTSAEASPMLEGVPAVAETLPGYEMDAWFALFAPDGTPEDRIQLLADTVDEILADPEVVKHLQTQAYEIVGGGPEVLTKALDADLARYEQLVRDANISIE
ncbi:Bug family tripartite tricarboxylate transporter substrate binding protein [Devosia sp. A449]